MRGRHTLVWILVVSPLAAAAGCSGGENLPPGPTADPSINITGTFIGQVRASLPTRTDVTQAVLQLAQSGSSVLGTYSADNGRSANVSGSVSGARLTLAVTFTDACPGSASTTADITNNATRLTGTYTANDCLGNYSGGFALEKQPAPAAVATVTITPGSATIGVGSTVQLTATPKDAASNPLTGRTVTWASSSTSVAIVSFAGLVTGMATGTTSVSATVESKTATAAITVTPGPIGQIAVITVTSGTSLDPDGYTIRVDGGTAQPLGINTTVTLGGLAEGGHTVELGGIASNCTVAGSNPRSVTVAGGSTMQVTFEISCSSTPPPPPPEPTLAFTADPPSITVGQSSVLNWSATDASQCNASDSWMGNKPLSGNELVSPTSTATYTLTCSGSGGSVTKSVTVTVNAPPPPPPLPNCAHTTDVTRTPDYQPYKPLMEQVVPAGPVYVTSTTAVADCALLDAGYMLQIMLRNRADVASALRDSGTLTGVFGLNESVCDLPYFSDLRQLDPEKCDARGGLGGVIGRYATACSEANLLKDSADPYGRGTRPDGENVCVHELGHSIMNIGLSDADRAAIRQRFEAVKSEGQVWTQDAFGNPTFALANADEFWAEITQVYFCANPAVSAFLHNGVNCADQMQQYDLETFRLVDGIYRGAADLQ